MKFMKLLNLSLQVNIKTIFVPQDEYQLLVDSDVDHITRHDDGSITYKGTSVQPTDKDYMDLECDIQVTEAKAGL